METTDHTDDTILDDEIDEPEFNFDNENEDALLAETEYDFVEATETRIRTDPEPEDHPEAEEDVLDIGIAEEDIVDAESTAVTQLAAEIESDRQIAVAEVAISESSFITDSINKEDESSSVRENECDVIAKDDEYTEKKTTLVSDSAECDEQDAIISPLNNLETSEKNTSKKLENTLEKGLKSTIISLRKSAGRNYDNLPALANVIEKVQPAGSPSQSSQLFRNRKPRIRESENDNRGSSSRKRVESSAYKRRYDHDDSRRSERRRYMSDSSSDHYDDDSSRYKVERGSSKWISLSENSTSRQYKEYSLDSTLESNMTRQLMDECTRYENTSTSAGFAHQSIVASVQITQERYHITSDMSVPINDGSYNRAFCDFGANTAAVSLPPPPGIQQVVPPEPQPFFHPPRPAQPPFMENNMLARPPPATTAIRNPTMVPYLRPMPPPHPPPIPLHLPPPAINCPVMSPSGAPVVYPNNNTPFPSPHPHMPFSGLPHQMRPAPPPPSSQRMNGPLFPPPVPNHLQVQPAPMTHFHMRLDTGQPPPPTNFGPPPLVSNRGPIPFRQLAPPQQMQGPPRMAPNYAPRIPLQPSTSSNMGIPQPAAFPAHDINPIAMRPPNSSPIVYQQPPPPGVHSNQHLTQPPFCQTSINQVNYSQYESSNQQIQQQQQEQQQQQQQQIQAQQQQQQQQQQEQQPFYPVSSHFSYGTSVVRGETNASNSKRTNQDSMDGEGGYKQTRYDYSPVFKKDEDEEMTLYREKVEHQKKLREKFVQMKEEQRLKNQMQSFIQNNIKGILEKREQFLRKSEEELRAKSEASSRAKANDSRNMGSGDLVSQREGDSAPQRAEKSDRVEKAGAKMDKQSVSFRRVADLKPKMSTTPPRGESNASVRRNSSVEVAQTISNKSLTSDQRQLHKVIKIKYKDGTVAFKSIPVHSTDSDVAAAKYETNFRSASDNGKSLLEEDGDRRIFNSGSGAQRRMVVAKRIPVPNVKNDTSNENAIVESIRKGVTQSSVPLAQRFANLRAANKSLNARPL